MKKRSSIWLRRKPARNQPHSKPELISSTALVILTATWIVGLDNISFWQGIYSAQEVLSQKFWFSAGALATTLVLSLSTVLRLLAFGRIFRPVLMLILVSSAAAAHFVDGWGVLIDKAMIRNLLETDWNESRELMTASLFIDLIFRGILPAIIVASISVRQIGPSQWGVSLLILLLSTLIIFGTSFWSFNSIYAPTFRAHRELRLQLVPTNFINGAIGLVRSSNPMRSAPTMVGQDAVKAQNPHNKPLLTVLVVGETARAQNFSLGGYAKPTNAVLKHENITYFNNVVSCGTDTATSLPCMFSNLGMNDFSLEKARSQENVLDVLQRAGVKVSWIDNNSGCKGVCERVPTKMVRNMGIPRCTQDTCYDESLVDAMASQISSTSDSLIVLHLQGSHGPAYFKRYPNPGVFEPACDTIKIQDCSRETLLNAYDNSIEYTSQVLDQIIHALMKRDSEVDAMMIYISDHGESLGEKGLYLHGMPMILAPKEQYQIPMIFWLSAGAEYQLNIKSSCLKQIAAQPISHDNLFHTLLGMKRISSVVYKENMDLLTLSRSKSPC